MISSEFPPGPGGIGNHAYHLALNLRRLGWEIVVLSPQDYTSAEEAGRFNSHEPLRIVSVPSGRGRLWEALHRLWVAKRLAGEHKPNVLLGTGLSGVWVTSALGAMRRLPTAAVAHGSEFGMNRGIPGAVNRWAYQRAAAVVAVSQFTRHLIERAGIRPRRIEVIPNAADSKRFVALPEAERQVFRQQARLNGGSLLLTVGHVSARKGQEVVIRALPRILKQVPAVQYAMIGLPTLQPELTGLAEELGVADHIRFLGRVDDAEMIQWLNACDLFVMTSRTTADGDCEGFGIAVVEAALCGKPAIVSSQSGLIEAIQDGITGLAVPENDEKAAAAAVISLLADPARRQAMAEAAHARALREQTWETCALKYDTLLRSLITDH